MNDSYMGEETSKEQAPTSYAGFWVRVGAALIDALVLLPLTGLFIYNMVYYKSLPAMIVLAILTALYKPLMEMEKSATIGKMALKLKVVDMDFQNISADQAFTRFFPWAITQLLGLSVNIHLFSNPAFLDLNDLMEISILTQESPLFWYSSVYNYVFLGLVGSLIFDAQKQGTHDKVAGTYVIREK